MAKLSFDTAGRITLPETLCEMFGLTDWVVVVGLGDRFQIWGREAFQAHRAAQRELAREGLAQLRAQQRAHRLGGAS
jgi:MraZ protein